MGGAEPLSVVEHLAPERAALLSVLTELTPDEWAAPTGCPAWTVHGVALHILGDDLSLLSRQRDAAPNGVLLYAGHHPGLDFRQLLDGFNERWVTAGEFLSPALVVELLRLTGEWTLDHYGQVDPMLLGEPVFFFGATGPSPMWQAIGREYVERMVHQHQIRAAVGRPPVAAELVEVAATVVVHGVAGFVAGITAPEGSAVTVRLGPYVHSLTRTGDGWAVTPGATPGAPETAVDPEPSPDVLLGGPDAAMALGLHVASAIADLNR